MKLFTFSPNRFADHDLSDQLDKCHEATTQLKNLSNHFIGYVRGLVVQLRDEAAHLAAAIWRLWSACISLELRLIRQAQPPRQRFIGEMAYR
jgi:hypothetical protein